MNIDLNPKSNQMNLYILQVKRVAMAELQRAVALAERRAFESLTNDRLKIDLQHLVDQAPSSSTNNGEGANSRAKGHIKEQLGRRLEEMELEQVRKRNYYRARKNECRLGFWPFFPF